MYQKIKDQKEIRCNACGRVLSAVQGIPQECVTIDHTWGYFSDRDGQRIRFTLCESCVEKLTAGFAIPPVCEKQTELFPGYLPEDDTV